MARSWRRRVRRPFTGDYGVPDTVEGRFDLIVLHLVLLIDRLGCDDDAGRGIGQRLFDVFCRDLDGNLREMGVGDLAVPKRMRALRRSLLRPAGGLSRRFCRGR